VKHTSPALHDLVACSCQRPRRSVGFAAAALLLAASALLVPTSAFASRALCVGPARGCYHSLQAAIDSAKPGAVIRIRRGTYRGGVTISKSLTLMGAGERRSVIRGGGPVLTIASPSSAQRPHVTITGLRITGGNTHGTGFVALGGGLFVPPVPGGDFLGATVSLRRVLVDHNRTAPTTTSSSPSGVKCPGGDCPFALTRGGGIANFGNLTLSHVTVTKNVAGGHASDSNGGGILSALGSLRIIRSQIRGNRAQPISIGRYAEGGGIFLESGALSLRNSRITRNRSVLVTSWPVRGQGELIDMNANGGGVHVGDDARATVEHTRLDHNVALANDPDGEPIVFDSAMFVGDSALIMGHTTIDHNAVVNHAATSDDAGYSGSALELDGPGAITHTRILHNPVHTYSQNGSAASGAGLVVADFSNNPRQVTVRHSAIRGNVAVSNSRHGVAVVFGGGVQNNSLLRLDHTVVAGNLGIAYGPHATAQGGGIWNGALLSGPPVVLRLLHSRVVGNRLLGSTGATREGGGLYTTESVIRMSSSIRNNRPDQCFGCSSSSQRYELAPPDLLRRAHR
jgi:hypothetical protein